MPQGSYATGEGGHYSLFIIFSARYFTVAMHHKEVKVQKERHFFNNKMMI